MKKEEKTKPLAKHETKAINDFVKSYYTLASPESFEANNYGDILSEIINIYYNKRKSLTFKKYIDTYNFLKHAKKYGELTWYRKLNESHPDKIKAKERWMREEKYKLEELENEEINN